MTVIMGLDPASGFGWAVHDLDRPRSAIISGSLKLTKGASISEKILEMKYQFVPLIRDHNPLYVCIEAPFTFLPEGGGSTVTISEAGQLAGAASAFCLAWNIHFEQVMPNTWQTIIPSDIKDMFPTWPDGTKKVNPLAKRDDAAPKKRAKVCCDRLKIVSPNGDSRDASLIAAWAGSHSQLLKLVLHNMEKAA